MVIISVKDKIQKQIAISEGSMIACLWKSPDLYSDYDINKDELSEDALFYYSLGEQMYITKYDVFDEVAVYATINDNEELKSKWEVRGGWDTMKEMISKVNITNFEGYFNAFAKYVTLRGLYNKGFNIESEWDKLEAMSAAQVYDYYEYFLNSIALDVVSDIEFESLTIDDDELREMDAGQEMGIDYSKYCPILNSLTMGLPTGEMSVLAGHVNTGKTSFSVANIVIPMAMNKTQVCIISNEQRSMVFKQLLLVHALTHHVNYWNLTRKKIKAGNYTDEDKKALDKARQVIKEKYEPYITFVKLYEYNTSIVKKIIKKLSKRGLQMVLYDTFKASSTSTQGGAKQHEKLVEDSRDLFQIASKNNLAFLSTCQLALNQMGKRYLDLNTLAGARAISEVCSEVLQFRPIFDDEFAGERYDIKPYRLKRDRKTGKFTSMRETVELDRNKTYIIVFLSKTRNDEQGKTLVYEMKGAFNKWKEVAMCTVQNTGY